MTPRDDSDDESIDLDPGASALGVLAGPALDRSLGGLGRAMDATTTTTTTRRATSATTRESTDDATRAMFDARSTNPFDVDAAELEARRDEPLGVGAETNAGADDASARTRDASLDDERGIGIGIGVGVERDVEPASPRTPTRAGGGGGEALENGSYHANAGMSYGDLLAPPPSYADSVMYAQPEIQPARDVGANAVGGTTTTVYLDGDDGAGDEETLQIWVSDPKIEADTSAALVGKRVTHYKITTRTTIPSYIHKEVVVWRRFRDFVALDARLSALHRGYFIPASTGEDGCELDGRQLHRRTRDTAAALPQSHRIALQASLGDPLRIFLTHQDLASSLDWFNMTAGRVITTIPSDLPSSPETPQRPPIAVASPGQPRDFGRFFKELRQTVVQSTAVSAVGGVLGLDTPKPKVMEEDAAFLVEKDRVVRMENELSGMSSKATKLLTLQQKFGEAVGEFGLECLKFAKIQEEEGTRLGKYSENGLECMTAANEMRKAGNTSIKVSRVSRAATAQTAQSLEPLHDYLKIMPSVRRSISDRNESLLTLQTMLAEADRLEARIAKLTPDFTKMKKVEDLKLELDATRATGEQAKVDYKIIQDRHREEFARLEKERVAQFHAMLLNYSRVQVANAERSLSLWRGLAEEFGASADEWRTPEPEKSGEADETTL